MTEADAGWAEDRLLSLADVRRALRASRRRHLPRVLIGTESDLPPQLDNTACLFERADGSWAVSYFERGGYFGERVFADEDDACRDFLSMLRVPIDESSDEPSKGPA